MAMPRTVNGHTLSLNTLGDAVDISSFFALVCSSTVVSASVDIAPPPLVRELPNVKDKGEFLRIGTLHQKNLRRAREHIAHWRARWPIYVGVICGAPVRGNFFNTK